MATEVALRAPVQQVQQARLLAGRLLAGLPDRWRHTNAVAGRAVELSCTVRPAERDTLIAAAWLHDIGYAEELRRIDFHPLDGASWLERCGWSPRLAALVAHHSGARFVARLRGLGRDLGRYPHEESPVSDALTFADQTVGPRGERLPIGRRMADMLRRHGPDSVNARAHAERGPYLLEVAGRVERRLVGSDAVPSAPVRRAAEAWSGG